MNKIFLAILFVMSCNPVFAVDESSVEAQRLYSERDYSAQGVANAKAAAEMYGRLASGAKGSELYDLKTGEAKAFYFVGSASKTKEEKIAFFQMGIDASKMVTKDFLPDLADEKLDLEAEAKKVLAKHTPAEVVQLAFGLYYAGINLGSWAEANGVMQSLKKWPELRSNMLVIQLLGHKEIALFGSSRVLGRAYYKLPKIAGGDMEKAGKYLSEAFAGSTNAKGVSSNGNNNIFWAEYLNEIEKVNDAKQVLKNFIDSNLNDLDPEALPENKNLQQIAKAILDRWEE
ncbi:MAG: hypothetical protein SGJ18_05120 [Pseudomonadota bacterium]|nr:hypothetical protein [Pseudomonadota bacterium]